MEGGLVVHLGQGEGQGGATRVVSLLGLGGVTGGTTPDILLNQRGR